MDLQRLDHDVPALVFVHGFGCSRADWRAQLEHFGSRAEMLAIDLRGHGATPGAPEECSIETYGADVAALIERSGLERAVLVGHSMGCRVVLEAHRRAPERIAGLVLIDGSRVGTGDPAMAEKNARRAFAGTEYAVFARKFFSDMFLSDSDPALKARTVEQALRLPEDIGRTLFPRMVAWDAGAMDAALEAVRAPLMVIQSTYLNGDRVRTAIKPGESTPWIDLVRSRIPTARIEIIPGTGHFPQLEAPAKVSALVEDFHATIGHGVRL